MNESDEESNWNSNIKRFVRSKKRTRILEISDSSTEADDVYKFRLHYENYNQKIKKVKRKKEEIFYTCSKILFMLRNSKIEKLCNNRFTENARISLFNLFWKIRNFNKQNTFVCSSTQRAPVKRRRSRNFIGSVRYSS